MPDVTRPDLLSAGRGRLTWIEREQLAFVRATFEPGTVDETIRLLQRHLGSLWIWLATRRLLHVHGAERLPAFDPEQSYLCVANHRSFFDMYVATAYLVRQQGLKSRILFPVRSGFFYDNPAGLLVNGAMSFFAMYPPVFRDRKRASMNLLALDEMVWLLNRGGVYCGLHPEGTRNQSPDPYSFLPGHRGTGRVVHRTTASVIPVYINGLGNDLPRQVGQGLAGNGEPIYIVFGEPMDFSDLRAEPAKPATERKIVDRIMARIAELGEEARELRAAAGHDLG